MTLVWDTLVLAGGRSSRMGRHKPGIVVDGTSLLDRVLLATAGAATTVVVGPEQPTARPVTGVLEDPPYAGPVPALAAGLPLLSAEVVVLLAADLVQLQADHVEELVARAPAVLVDDDGREQWLCGAWPRALLRPDVERLQDVLRPLEPVRLALPGWADVDTPEDLTRWTA